MSDNHQCYRSIRTALAQLYFKEPKGYTAKQLNVLATLINGIVGSRRTNYPQIASKVPDHTQLESRVKRFERFIIRLYPKEELVIVSRVFCDGQRGYYANHRQ